MAKRVKEGVRLDLREGFRQGVSISGATRHLRQGRWRRWFFDRRRSNVPRDCRGICGEESVKEKKLFFFAGERREFFSEENGGERFSLLWRFSGVGVFWKIKDSVQYQWKLSGVSFWPSIHSSVNTKRIIRFVCVCSLEKFNEGILERKDQEKQSAKKVESFLKRN
ncbi:hypothetical protein U1Q18_012589 [Sarracenia purpurea var. burkii]